MVNPTLSHGDCLILPVGSHAVITLYPATSLRWPQEHKTVRRPGTIVAALFVALVLWLHPTPTHATVSSSDVLTEMNTERMNYGLTPLQIDERLAAAASAKANDMLRQQYFSHASPSGERAWQWMERAGYHYTEAGENLAMDFIDSHDVVVAWMGSASHRKNILASPYQDAGIAVIDGQLDNQPTTLVVALFGRQSSATSTASLTSTTLTPPVPEAPQPSTPVTTPAPALPTQTVKTIPSLVEPGGRPQPTLVFTIVEPKEWYYVHQKPVVLGATDEVQITLSVPNYHTPSIGLLVFGGLAIMATVLVVYGLILRRIYPQPKLALALAKLSLPL